MKKPKPTKKIKVGKSKPSRAHRAKKPLPPAGMRLVSYEITDKPIPDPEYDALPEAVHETSDELYHMLSEEPGRAINEALKLIERYPHIPNFRNYLYATYMLNGQKDKAEAVARETYRAFPDYLFGRLNYIECLLQNNRLDEIPKVLGGSFDLQAMYPERKVFHYTEVESFFTVVGLYCARTGKIDSARVCLDILRRIGAEEEKIAVLTLEVMRTAFIGRITGMA